MLKLLILSLAVTDLINSGVAWLLTAMQSELSVVFGFSPYLLLAGLILMNALCEMNRRCYHLASDLFQLTLLVVLYCCFY